MRSIIVLSASLALAGSALTAPTAHAAPAPRAATTAAASSAPAPGTLAVTLAKRGSTSVDLQLVSPGGARRHVSRLAAGWEAADVSGDGARVLVRDGGTFRVVDVRTGRATAVAGAWENLAFTKPSGTALIGAAADGRSPLVRADLAGRTTVRYAGTRSWAFGTMNPGGTLVATKDAAERLVVDTNSTGATVRRLPDPAGYRDCAPGHWVDATHFVATCEPASGKGSTQVFRYATDGSRPTSLTAGLRLPYTGTRYLDSWSTPSGQVVGLSGACGSWHLGLVTKGEVRILPNPRSGNPVGVAGNSAYFTDGVGECTADQAVVLRHDLSTGRRTVVAGGPADGGTSVQSVVLVTRP